MKLESQRTRNLATPLIAAVFCLTLGACAAVADLKGHVTGDPGVKLDSGLVWNTQVPDIYLPNHDEVYVYFHLRNLSGEVGDSVQDVKQSVRTAISEKGYHLVNRPDDADFTIRCDLRYFGENPGGATRGQGLYSALGRRRSSSDQVLVDSTLGPASSSGLFGGLMGEGLSNASRIVEWNVLMDFFISERMEGSQKRLSTSSETHAAEATAGVDGASRRTNATRRESSSSQTGSRDQDQFDHECSMTAWANKMRCSREEAAEGYLPKIASAVNEVLPDLL